MTSNGISVITVVLNDLAGLRRTANSLLLQTDSSFEWIIRDGGSGPDTAEFVATIRNPKAKYISEKDAGIYDAMNKAVIETSGFDLLFLNAGDELAPAAIECFQEARLKFAPDAVICSGWTNVDQVGNRSVMMPDIRRIPEYMPICHQATLIPRAVYDSLSGYDLRYILSADYDFFLRAFMANVAFEEIENNLVTYYRGGQSDKRLILSRMETVESLWRNKSPARVAGTVRYGKEMVRHIMRKYLLRSTQTKC